MSSDLRRGSPDHMSVPQAPSPVRKKERKTIGTFLCCGCGQIARSNAYFIPRRTTRTVKRRAPAGNSGTRRCGAYGAELSPRNKTGICTPCLRRLAPDNSMRAKNNSAQPKAAVRHANESSPAAARAATLTVLIHLAGLLHRGLSGR